MPKISRWLLVWAVVSALLVPALSLVLMAPQYLLHFEYAGVCAVPLTVCGMWTVTVTAWCSEDLEYLRGKWFVHLLYIFSTMVVVLLAVFFWMFILKYYQEVTNQSTVAFGLLMFILFTVQPLVAGWLVHIVALEKRMYEYEHTKIQNKPQLPLLYVPKSSLAKIPEKACQANKRTEPAEASDG